MMQKYAGICVFGGIAEGPAFLLRSGSVKGRAPRREIKETEAEIERFTDAVKRAQEQVLQLYGQALRETGEKSAAIFEGHRMLLDDRGYQEAVRRFIRDEKVNAEYAVQEISGRYSEKFAGMESEYLRARAADMQDIAGYLSDSLAEMSVQELLAGPGRPSVVIAEELSPGELMRLDRKKILALLLVRGSVHSHVSILARTMGIPALTGVEPDLMQVEDGTEMIVDSFRETVIVSPVSSQRETAGRRIFLEQEKKRRLGAFKGRPSATMSGRTVRILANIGSPADILQVLENDAEGIGLFRSEFLYLGRRNCPSEEEQFEACRQVLSAMGGKTVVVRTLDMDQDKQEPYLVSAGGENAGSALRGIRFSFARQDIFRTQLRALLRASVFGNLSIMYPMVTCAEELRRAKKIVREVFEELKAQGIPCEMPRQGVMIETPAAVMRSGELACEADFFSIGTNDLTRYALAVDRQSSGEEEQYDPGHEAVLGMIRMAADQARRHGKRVGICGDLAADPALAGILLEMGLDEFSVPPAVVLELRERICGLP